MDDVALSRDLGIDLVAVLFVEFADQPFGNEIKIILHLPCPGQFFFFFKPLYMHKWYDLLFPFAFCQRYEFIEVGFELSDTIHKPV
jgi:hypothetical protein